MANPTDRELLEGAARAAGKRERHGMNKTSEHQAWVHMKQRCTNQNKREWEHYGGRGIKVCDEWMSSFLAFYNHIGQRPSAKHSLDRINVNGDYEPGNVRWATQQQQIDNTRTVRMVTLDGITKSISAWEREYGLPKGTVCRREASGWGLDEAIKTVCIAGQKKHKYVPQGYTKLKTGWFRVKLDGKYIKTVHTEKEAKELVAATRRAIVRAAYELGKEL